ncbi:MAG: amino acid permease [Myxococcales bacterium]|nr:amino acid permease [Myxococcales bacterium]
MRETRPVAQPGAIAGERGTESGLPRRLGGVTATLVVIASMIGSGAFTTTGLLVGGISSTGGILLAWLIGGVVALFGALSYAELAACIPRNGGEYRLLGEVYHPAVGFVAGWISLVVGFSAPIAASALGFAAYVHALWPALPPKGTAIALVLMLSLLHAARVTLGASVQNVFAAAKVLLIVAFVVGALFVVAPPATDSLSIPFGEILQPPFAVGLILVGFAYSGWNGAAYLAGEVHEPKRNLPLALVAGTAIVTLLYLGLNAVFLVGTTRPQLRGTVEVGHVAAVAIFGDEAGRILSSLIALALISSVSAMVMVGPRVYEAMGDDYRALRFLRRRTEQGGPRLSIALQALLATLMIVTASFGELLLYIGFTLSLSAGLTVVGVIVWRRRAPELARPYRTWGYPLTPALFAAFSGWMIVHSFYERPLESLFGVATIVVGLLIYWIVRRAGLSRWD